MSTYNRVLRWVVAILFGMSVSVAGIRTDAADGKAEKWAVLIGIDDYAHAKKLKYAVADQQALNDELIKSGFDKRQVTLLRDKAESTQFLPFKSNVEKQISLICDLAEAGDLVFIAFSGHGRHMSKKSFICPADGKLDEADTMIALDWVYERLQKCKADLKLVMVDACRDVDPFLGGQRGGNEPERKEEMRAFISSSERLPDGLILLHSCSEGEKANEDENLGHGVFTHFLLEGLRGKADENTNGKVTLGELMLFASRETKLYVKDKFADLQRPKMKGNYTLEAQDFELIAFRGTRPPPTLPTTPRQPQHDAPASEQRRSEFSNSLGMKLVPFKAG
ncbi:MAG: caspase family protein, partial [Pirellulaceae bacterium]|nr:caspase family protein [Pirellulaceae bacterium]